MKNYKIILAVLSIALFIGFFSACNTSEQNNNATTPIAQQPTSAADSIVFDANGNIKTCLFLDQTTIQHWNAIPAQNQLKVLGIQFCNQKDASAKDWAKLQKNVIDACCAIYENNTVQLNQQLATYNANYQLFCGTSATSLQIWKNITATSEPSNENSSSTNTPADSTTLEDFFSDVTQQLDQEIANQNQEIEANKDTLRKLDEAIQKLGGQ